MFELVIFDCDGVLVDSERLACQVDADCLTEAGFPIGVEDILERFRGRAADSMFREIEAEFGRALPADLPGRLTGRLELAFRRELQAMPGAHAMLNALPFRACVASSSSRACLELSLRLTGLHKFLGSHVFSADAVKQGKPAPDLFQYAARRMEADVTRCAIIEDSVPGILAALAAGAVPYGFAGGSHIIEADRDALRSAGAAVVFDDLVELPKILTASIDRHRVR